MSTLEPSCRSTARPPGRLRRAEQDHARREAAVRRPSERVAELAKQTIPGAAAVSVTLMQGRRGGQRGLHRPARRITSTSASTRPGSARAWTPPCPARPSRSRTPPTAPPIPTSPGPPPATASRHTMSFGLPVARQTIGALNVYATDETPFDETTPELATAFASLRGGGRGQRRRLRHHRHPGGQPAARPGLPGSHRPGEGHPLWAGNGTRPTCASTTWPQQSQATNRKLRDIAADLVDEVQRGAPGLDSGRARPMTSPRPLFTDGDRGLGRRPCFERSRQGSTRAGHLSRLRSPGPGGSRGRRPARGR